MNIFLLTASLASALHLILLCSGQQTGPALTINSDSPLRLAALTSVSGCPVTVFLPANNASRAAYLAPTLCIQCTPQDLLSSVCAQRDPLTDSAFMDFPVQILSSSLLMEARESLRSILQGRTVEFLQPTAIRVVNSQVNMDVMWETGLETAYLRVFCRSWACNDLVSQLFKSRVGFLEDTKLEMEIISTSSRQETIKLAGEIVMANWSRNLVRPTFARDIPLCTNLRHIKSIFVSETCLVNVYKNNDRKGHFLIEPMFCYHGNYSLYDTGYLSGVSLTLEMFSERVKLQVQAELSELSPLFVEFMSLADVEVVNNFEGRRWGPSSLRFKSGGKTAEWRIWCSRTSCEALIHSLQLSPQKVCQHLAVHMRSHVDFRCSWRSRKYPMALKTPDCRGAPESTVYASSYHEMNSSLCIRPEFVRNFSSVRNADFCANRCNTTEGCLAFTFANSHCQLFLFDKCSRNFIDPECRRWGQVFVKKIWGLRAGQLCPHGYGRRWRGMQYKMYNTPGDWVTGRHRCESVQGLVVMADVESMEEFHWVRNMSSQKFYLGGFQTTGSDEPLGGWHWVGCNRTISRDLWATGEPNNWEGRQENVVSIVNQFATGINDEKHSERFGFLCKCVSPFSD